MNIEDMADYERTQVRRTQVRKELDKNIKATKAKLAKRAEVKAIRAMMENTPKHGDLVGAEIIYVRDILEYILNLEAK